MDDERPNRRFIKLTKDYEQKKIFDGQREKYKYVVVYIGKYYCRTINEKNLRKIKLSYLILTFFGMLLYLLAASQKLLMNTVWYTALVQTIWILDVLIFVCCLIKFLSAPMDMKEKVYRAASVWLKRTALIAVVMGVASAIITLFSPLLCSEDLLMCLIYTFVYTVSSACFFAIFFLEHRMEYTIRQSQGGPEDEL